MKKRILVIDDNCKDLYLMRFILESDGFEVIEAETGTDGVQKAKDSKLDLIIMDIKLHDCDVLETTRRIREFDKATPIVALSYRMLPGDEALALEAGCTGYIIMPIDPDTILCEIKSFLLVSRDSAV